LAGVAELPDGGPPARAAGVGGKIIPTEQDFPHMAHGMAASDQLIQEKPELVRNFVHAALKGMMENMDERVTAADAFVAFVPDWKGKEAAVKFVLHYYAEHVYPGQRQLGEIDPDRLKNLQDFYVAKGLIQKAAPVGELYSNAFIR